MTTRISAALLVVVAAAGHAAFAQGVRSHTRLTPRGTAITQSQASDLTLTLTRVETRPVQTWVRTAGELDKAGKIVALHLTGPDAMLVRIGQRARTFPVESRSSMYQARVIRVAPDRTGVHVDVELASTGRENTTNYLVEIVTERGDFLSVPNEAIIEEGGTQIVYRQIESGRYEPQAIRTGIQGELYTQILDGAKEGDEVVTFGSFFIDSEYKLKGMTQGSR